MLYYQRAAIHHACAKVLSMITLDYSSELAQRVSVYFRKHVFVVGEGPDFFKWIEEQGGVIRNENKIITIEFEDHRLYTLFVLKYSV